MEKIVTGQLPRLSEAEKLAMSDETEVREQASRRVRELEDELSDKRKQKRARRARDNS